MNLSASNGATSRGTRTATGFGTSQAMANFTTTLLCCVARTGLFSLSTTTQRGTPCTHLDLAVPAVYTIASLHACRHTELWFEAAFVYPSPTPPLQDFASEVRPDTRATHRRAPATRPSLRTVLCYSITENLQRRTRSTIDPFKGPCRG